MIHVPCVRLNDLPNCMYFNCVVAWIVRMAMKQK